MDRIAYTPGGFAYLVDDSPVSISPEFKRLVVANLKRQGVLDNDIPGRLEGIEAEMMKIEMANIGRAIDDKGAVLNLTLETTVPINVPRPVRDDQNNQVYVDYDRNAADGLCSHGMHVVTPEKIRNLSRGNEHYHGSTDWSIPLDKRDIA